MHVDFAYTEFCCGMKADGSTAAISAAPAAVQPVAASAPVAAAASAAPAPAAASAASSEPLPEGWSEAVDPTYNHPYWYNVSTGKRTWVRPKAAATAAHVATASAPQQACLYMAQCFTLSLSASKVVV